MLTSGKETYEAGEVIFEEGSFLNLEFNLPNSNQVIHTKGKVAWARSKDISNEKMPAGFASRKLSELIRPCPEGMNIFLCRRLSGKEKR